MLAIHVLASGSKGNASILEDLTTGHGILIDAGICKRDFLQRTAEAHFDVDLLDGILITHDHSDHTSGLGVIARGLKRPSLKLYALPDVLNGCRRITECAPSLALRSMHCGEGFRVGAVEVMPVRTFHDAIDSCGFRFTTPDGDALGYVTDTGYIDKGAKRMLSDVRILALESNHDPDMLRTSPYPASLRARIASNRGHLSNVQAADALRELMHLNLEHVIALHLSENNNLPSLARKSLEAVIDECGSCADVTVAAQYMLKSVR